MTMATFEDPPEEIPSSGGGSGSAATQIDIDGITRRIMQAVVQGLSNAFVRSDSFSDHRTEAESKVNFGLDGGDDTSSLMTRAAAPFIPQRQPSKAAVKKIGYWEFKNYASEEDKSYALVCLVSNGLIEAEMRNTQQRRDDLISRGARAGPRHPKNKSLGAKAMNHLQKPGGWSSLGVRWIQRIRIQSPGILGNIKKIIGQEWDIEPRTFFRPFKLLIYLQPQMKAALKVLENRWGDASSQGPATPIAGEEGESRPILDDSTYKVEDSPEAYKDMKCYVDFMDKEIMGEVMKFREFSGPRAPKVRFEDLWYLFWAGDLLYEPAGADSDKSNSNNTRQSIWRIVSMDCPLPKYQIPPVGGKQWQPENYEEENLVLNLTCYYIDCTGDEFVPVTKEFVVRPFEGERDIRKLNVYPLIFAVDSKGILERATKRGRDFIEYQNIKHLSYNFRTVTQDPKGDDIVSAGNPIRHPESINSDVIVDFEEAFVECPSWEPECTDFKQQELDKDTIETDDFPICLWSGSTMIEEIPETIQLEDPVDTIRYNHQILENDKFIVKVRENDMQNAKTTAEHLRTEDLCLLPKRVFAYVLRDRKWAQLDVRRLKPIVGNSDAFDSLTIKTSHKEMVQGLVESHFSKKKAEKENMFEGMSQDLIPGKGRGLFILLHGVPGVGKTATAEAVAQANGKPLFTITSGDLGVTAKEVDKSLNEIFRLANLWDTVLLIDEVDTFFSQRTKSDLEMNALVSVFLRVLEYYNGILFLTTNRAGAIDEAFKSRIHISLYYPRLDEEFTMKIWKMNIDRLAKINEKRIESTKEPPLKIKKDEIMRFAKSHFKKHTDSEGRWNGRQIRNAFTIAASLAYHDMRTDLKAMKEAENEEVHRIVPVLGKQQFETIDQLTSEFDQYMNETREANDEEMAFEMGIRKDNFDAHKEDEYYDGGGGRDGPGTFNRSATFPARPGIQHTMSMGEDPRSSSYLNIPGGQGQGNYPRSPNPNRGYIDRGMERSMERGTERGPVERGPDRPLERHGSIPADFNEQKPLYDLRDNRAARPAYRTGEYPAPTQGQGDYMRAQGRGKQDRRFSNREFEDDEGGYNS